MVLLKIGGLHHLNEGRIDDILTYFDKVICIGYEWEKVDRTDRVEYIRFKSSLLNKLLFRVEIKLCRFKIFSSICWMILVMLRIINPSFIRAVKSQKYDYAYSSYSDYEKSDFLTNIIAPYIGKKLIRAVKESRPGFNYDEYKCFRYSGTIIFNASECKAFFEKKYGRGVFKRKKILLGWDENALSEGIMNKISVDNKLSSEDGKIHIVIMAGRVFSDMQDKRSGARLYYLGIIKELLEKGYIIHLHTKAIFPDRCGIDRYEEIREKYEKSFFIEEPLDMRHDFIGAMKILSRYNYGILHNHVEGEDVSDFDRVNIPHRFYEYEAAGVLPIIERGFNEVVERIILKYNCGVVYDDLGELKENREGASFYKPIYREYIKDGIIGGLDNEI